MPHQGNIPHGLIEAGTSQGQGPSVQELSQALRGRGDVAGVGVSGAGVPRTPGTGVGLIDIFTRGNRERAAAKLIKDAAGQQAILETERGESLLAASGVDLTPFRPERRQALQQLLADPETRAAGEQELNELQAAQSINITPAQSHQIRRGSVDLRIADQQLAAAEMNNNILALEEDRAFGRAPDPTRLIDTANNLRAERAKDLAPYNDSLRSFDELQAAITLDSGPASMAVLFKFIKALDDSVVRSSEGQLLTSSSGPIRALVDQFNQIQAGGLFGPETKRDIMEVATAIAQVQFQAAERINSDHDTVAARFGERFGMPSVVELSQSAAFDRGRTFEQRTQPPPTPAPAPVAAPRDNSIEGLIEQGAVLNEDGSLDMSGVPGFE